MTCRSQPNYNKYNTNFENFNSKLSHVYTILYGRWRREKCEMRRLQSQHYGNIALLLTALILPLPVLAAMSQKILFA